MEIITFIESLNWQGIISLIAVVWFFTYEMKKDLLARMDGLEKRMDLLDERIFLLSTGKTLSQAMLEQKMNKEEKKEIWK